MAAPAPHLPLAALVGMGALVAWQDFARSPLTLLIFGTTAGYYAWYAFGLIRWHRSATQAAA